MPYETVSDAETAVTQAVQHELVVVENFLGHVRGEVICEAQKVRDLLESEWSGHFVKRLKAAETSA